MRQGVNLSMLWFAMTASGAAAHADPAAPLDRAPPVAAQGNTHLAAVIKGAAITVDLVTRIQRGTPEQLRLTSCTQSHVPCTLLSRMRVRVRGKDVDVPDSLVLRLSDLNRAMLTLHKSGKYDLVIDGGDASEGYNAHVIFDRQRVTELDIIAGEAGMLAERTVYFDLSHAFN